MEQTLRIAIFPGKNFNSVTHSLEFNYFFIITTTIAITTVVVIVNNITIIVVVVVAAAAAIIVVAIIVWRARKKSELSKHFIYHVFVVSSLIYSLWRLVGCILICFNVTARCC